jgi:hypothetical protein
MGGGVVGREWLPTVRMGTTQRRDGGAPEAAPAAGRAISVQGVQSAIAHWANPQPLTLIPCSKLSHLTEIPPRSYPSRGLYAASLLGDRELPDAPSGHGVCHFPPSCR